MSYFFAALPDVVARSRIAAAAATLSLASKAILVPRKNYHVTLAFVGAVPPERVTLLQAIGRNQLARSFALHFTAYEYWPKPEVMVVAAQEIPVELVALWQNLHRDLAKQELSVNPKRLRPHATIARKVLQPPVFQAMSPFSATVAEFSLMRSDASGERRVYTVLDTWSLLDKNADC